MYGSIAEVVEWLAPSTAVLEVVGSILAEGMFSETLSPAWTFPWVFSKVQIGKPNTVLRIDYKGVSRVYIKSEHVKDLAIKMATSTMVIRHRSDNAYIDEVHCKYSM